MSRDYFSKESYRKFVWLDIILRLVFAPLIFVSVWLATIVTFLLDWADGEIFKRARYSYQKYSLYDKLLDYYWYIFVLVFVFVNHLPSPEIFLFLFIFRSLGQGLFFWTKKERFLFLFPNVFEMFFFFFLLTSVYPQLSFLMRWPAVLLTLLVLTLERLFFEYIIHIRKWSVHNLLFRKKLTFWVD